MANKKTNQQPTKENLFRNDIGQVDWNKLLWHIWENKGEGRKLKEYAVEFKVHPVTLTNKYTGFEAFAKIAKGDQSMFSAAVSRQALNNKKNQYKLALERREINNVIRKDSIKDIIMDELIVPSLKPFKPSKYNQKTAPKDSKQVFFISDLHYKNMELATGLSDISDMIIEAWDGSKVIRIIWGGDYVEGRHHGDQQRTTASTMMQVTEVADIMAKIIANVISNTNAEVQSSYLIGNHDEIREGNTKAGENLSENIVGNLQTIVGLLLKEYKQYFDIGTPSYEISEELGDIKLNFRHGHVGHWADKSIMKRVIDEELQLHRSHDVYVFGHFHRWNDWMKKGVNKRFVICPSMKTWDGNFENANLLRNSTGITTFKSNGDIIMIPWKGEKLKDGEL